MANEATHTEVPAEKSAGGMPQLSQIDSFASQVFWLVITLIALYYVFSRIALPKIESTLEERHDTIVGDLDKAAELNLRAEAAAAEYATALAEARSEAQRIADETKADVKAQLDAAIAKADEQIAAKAAESTTRLAAIEAEAGARASEVANAAAEALLGRFTSGAVDASELSSAVANRLSGRFGG
ncbi:MAG: F0F1 ATP synthase subunit B' [Neomegalonema sp.]